MTPDAVLYHLAMPDHHGPAPWDDQAPAGKVRATDGVRTSASGMVEADRPCVSCSYNLRGLPVGGKCPECAVPVLDSLRGVLLEFASRAYVAKITTGLTLVLNGILLMVLMWVVVVLGSVMMSATGSRPPNLSLLVSMIGVGVSVLILLGYFRYSEPDPGFIGSERPDSARRVLRFAVAIQAGAALVEFLSQMVARVTSTASLTINLATSANSVVSMVAWVVQFFAVMRYTEWLAKRVPDHRVVVLCKRYRWLLPVVAVVGALVFMAGPLVALALYWNLLHRVRKHGRSILAKGHPARLPAMHP